MIYYVALLLANRPCLGDCRHERVDRFRPSIQCLNTRCGSRTPTQQAGTSNTTKGWGPQQERRLKSILLTLSSTARPLYGQVPFTAASSILLLTASSDLQTATESMANDMQQQPHVFCLPCGTCQSFRTVACNVVAANTSVALAYWPVHMMLQAQRFLCKVGFTSSFSYQHSTWTARLFTE